MEPIYSSFSVSHRVFYDRPGRQESDTSDGFAPNPILPPDGWNGIAEDHWSHWIPKDTSLPDQGWKIHVSTVPDSAAETLRLVSEYCYSTRLAFKHIRSVAGLWRSLGKDADRSASGKFIAIYPTSIAQLRTALEDLETIVGGRQGPYILSDLRWERGPLYVRYGAFIHESVFHEGRSVPAIRDLRSNALVPDVRMPSFQVPEWVTLPEFLQLQLNRLSASAPPHLPLITAVLHHSNAGGVYEAEENGRRVVLKESRPDSGWTPDGRDAVARLVDEERVLSSLPMTIRVPRPLGIYEALGHRFLALEYMEGDSLADAVVSRNPIAAADSTPEDFARYRDWALLIADSLRTQVNLLHNAGRTHGDLHPRNILVDADQQVTLLDFEMSSTVDDTHDAVVGVAGFVATDGRSPVDRDLYAVACVELYMFLPLTPLLQLGDSKATQLTHEAANIFDLPVEWADRLARLFVRRDDRGEVHTPRQIEPALGIDCAQIARTLLEDANPERFDRLWPGDPRQFSESPLSLAHGALGIAAALAQAGVCLTDDQTAWIKRAVAHRSRWPAGLMNGTAGSVWALRMLGKPDNADSLMEWLLTTEWRSLDSSLYSGIPGVALLLLAEADHRPALELEAIRMGRTLQRRLEDTKPLDRVGTDRGGLFGGATGTALLGLRLYERTGDSSFLHLSERALDFDIQSLTQASDGSLHVNEGWRVMPYLGYGSAGIGLVLAQHIAHDPRNERYRLTLERIVHAASAPFAAQSGLTHGRAGLIYFLAALDRLGVGTPASRGALARHREGLALHALHSGGTSRFVGNGLLRASCDLASGSAGILVSLALASETSSTADPLAFLLPPQECVSSAHMTTEGG